MKPIIEVNNLSKRYPIGRRESYGSLREEITEAFSRPFKRIFSPAGRALAGQDEVWALKDVSFNVAEGEIVGIIGRNGAGKSTLLKILSRITEPTEGRVVMRGRVSSLLEVGTGFHPELTGRENIFLNGALLGMTGAEIRARFDDIVAFSEIDKFLDTPVKRYSSGMYVRLAFAVAAHLEPEILIVDEVLAVGDSAFQRKCLGKMSEVARGGRTVLFVSHNMGAVQRLCSKAMLLKEGMLVMCARTEDVVDRYLSSPPSLESSPDLFKIQRAPQLGEKVRIGSARLLNSHGQATDTLKFGEPFAVEIECRGIEGLRGLQFVVGINSALDERISTILSRGGERAFGLKSGETKRGVVKIGLCLNPGRYSLTLGVRSSATGYDQLPNTVYFNVDAARHEGIIEDESVGYGFVHVAGPDWSIS